jgi:hypothetical protein
VAIPQREQRILQQRSGNICAFSDCRRLLTVQNGADGEVALLGEMAHIVGESAEGPRGGYPLPLDERNVASNLILLCNNHHQEIDDSDYAHKYTVEGLRGIKEQHEQWVERTLSLAHGARPSQAQPTLITETLYSNLLPVEAVPRYIYGVPCDVQSPHDVFARLEPERDVVSSLQPEKEMAPFILRGGMLYAFQDLNDGANPFRNLVPGQSAEHYRAREWWDEPDKLL